MLAPAESVTTSPKMMPPFPIIIAHSESPRDLAGGVYLNAIARLPMELGATLSPSNMRANNKNLLINS